MRLGHVVVHIHGQVYLIDLALADAVGERPLGGVSRQRILRAVQRRCGHAVGADAQIVAAGHGHADPIVPDRVGHPQGHIALAVAVPPVSGVYQLQLRLPRIDVPLERYRSLIVALQDDPRIVPLLLEV